MGPFWIAVLVSVAAAFLHALSAVLQRRGAKQAPSGDFSELIPFMLRSPVWLGGLAAIIGAFLLQSYALHVGTMTMVQSLLRVRLIFLLLLVGLMYERSIDRREILGILAILGGLAGFLYLADPSSPDTQPQAMAWVGAAAGTAAAFGLAVWIGHTERESLRAASLGVSAGLAFAITAALIKGGLAEVVQASFPEALAVWQLWAVIVTGTVAVLMQQKALRLSAITASQAATSITNLVASVLLGVLLFGEELRTGTVVYVGIGVSIVVVAAGIWLISSSDAVAHFES